MSPKILSFDEIREMQKLFLRFLPYRTIENIADIGDIYRMYNLIYWGHKSRAFELFLGLGCRKLVLPDWVFEYFNYGNKVTGVK